MGNESEMVQARTEIDRVCQEGEILDELLSLDGKHILELGCGTAKLTKAIASEGRDRRITAIDVDEVQIRRHQAENELPNVSFHLAGAEAIPVEDACADVVLMFKSLHHVPVDRLEQALREIHRVLKPGGLAYISEPLFQGDFNEILRLFHDERAVRDAAFAALREAVARGLFIPDRQVFFLQPRTFASFEEFESDVLHVTHTKHDLSEETRRIVRERFIAHMKEDGALFHSPIRADLLRKQA